MGYITWPSLLGSDNIYEGIRKECFALDETVLNREGQLLCFVWQDEGANQELRMLRELEKCEGALSFFDVNPEHTGVTIHGFTT